ncbi:1-phosphatidylinositol phosphodiesterase precursor [Trematosphaeria pertusa]|uniref:1-phosphatidylinositol phosphodiesterase n=1 Tax=Trematosphaeria pertusa TaxID=390896 RepID=A0A6A6HRN6_9PLEO|nr:1-phosphatidylinositol phosphodiesterase precursor [Trematosphaeria pertusa]KAF2240468.1 1-phosphatidylinositol phosphodiesterase precursor [Trematosphaeria pertusa]
MASPLTVRNLTPAPIVLKRVERFEDPNTRQSKASAFPFTSNDTKSLAPSAPRLSKHAQTFKHQDLEITLSPFESYTLQSNNEEHVGTGVSTLSTTALRITVESSGGERYRIEANPAYTQKASQAFMALTPNPSTGYTALFHPAKPGGHMTIYANHLHEFSKWMAALPPTLPLSGLSIPGTHNSHAYYRALPSVRCQVVSVKSQLENGIRFLDIRVQPAHATDTTKKDLYLVHGAFPISLTGTKYLEPVLRSCYEFLEENPSEAVLISLKREGVGSSSDEHLAEILEKHYISPNKDKWHIGTRVPYLGEVRGKLVLVRRYEIREPSSQSKGCGLDATDWPHNSTHAIHGPFYVQDWCEVMHPSDISNKLQYSNEHLVRSAECTAFIPGVNTDETNPIPPGPLYLNFLSGSNFWRMGTWPEKIAKIVNRGIEEWICMGHHLEDPLTSPREPGRPSVESAESESGQRGGLLRRSKEGDGGTGVVIMDMVGDGRDWDLVKLIVGMNMGVQLKMREPGNTAAER